MNELNLKYIDKTTKLKNRNYFMEKLVEYFDKNEENIFGVNILVSLENLIEANKKIGYLKVNKFLLDISKVFKRNISDIDKSIIARMNGSEFCFFLPKYTDKKALRVARKIQNEVDILIEDFNLQNLVTFFIGLYGYNHCNNISNLLSESDNVLSKAKLNRNNLYQKSLDLYEEFTDKEEYKDVIKEAIFLNNFYFISFKAVDVKHKKVIHNRLSLSLKGSDNTIYRYSEFIHIIKELNLIGTVYTNLLKMMFKTPDKTLNNSICSIRLPYEYLILENSYESMKNILITYKNNLEFQLIIEASDKFAYQYTEKMREYKKLLNGYNIDIGIYEFTGKNNNFEYIKILKPSYLKSDVKYLLALDNKKLLDIKIPLIATNVKDKKTLKKLEEKKIYFIQGSVTQFI